MPLAENYLAHIQQLQQQVFDTNRDALRAVGEAIGRSIAQNGVLHVFGSGHSGILAQEIVHRAGGLVPVSAIVDPAGGWPENLPGYGAKLFARHKWRHHMHPGEVLIVISNSGKNASPVEIALAGKDAGLTVVAITSLEMSRGATSQHESGKRLFEVADHVLDNGGVSGDAVLPVPGHELKTGPVSTMSGAILMNALVLDAIDWLAANGHDIPLLQSNNTGGKERNDRLSAKYRDRLSRPI